jgi:SSS family solute:Na+ symporter/sodium/proline symporter
LEIVAGIPTETGIIITAAFVIAYTALAGMISVAYTDLVNGIVITIGLVVAFQFLLNHAGGWEKVVANLPDSRISLMGEMTLKEALAYTLPTLLLLLGESNMYQRFFSARDKKSAKLSVIGWVIGTVVIETLIVVFAVVGSAIFPQIEAEQVMLYSAKIGVPVLIGCLLLAVIVAIIVSTADSFLLVPSTNIVHDFYQRFIKPEATQKQLVLYSRIAVIGLGIFAYLQVQFFETVLEMAIYAYTMYGAGITPALLASFLWKRATPTAGASSIAVGMITTILWEALGRPYDLATIYVAALFSILALIGISFITPEAPQDKIKKFYTNN